MTASTPAPDRTARHARQGIQTAARIFGEVRLNAPTADGVHQGMVDALAKIAAGPAPVAFKEAARAEMNRLFAAAYPAQTMSTAA